MAFRLSRLLRHCSNCIQSVFARRLYPFHRSSSFILCGCPTLHHLNLFFMHACRKDTHKRWPVEEDYKTMKCWLEVENFSGKSVLSIYQDFHAKVFSKNLTSVLAFSTREIIEQNSKTCKHLRQINFAQALSKVKDVIVLLFIRVKNSVSDIISDLHEIFFRTIEPIRLGRQFPRNHKSSRRLFYQNYKPLS